MSTDESVLAALREHATPLAGTAPASTPDAPDDHGQAPDGEREDLAALRGAVTEADVVGLGEATHGTRECFELKHRLVRFLVEDLGFRTLAMEADAAAALAVDDYVRQGEGDPAAAVENLGKWPWRTESVRDLVAWLRSFNAGRAADDRVRVRGVDLSDPAAPAAPLASYLRDVDPGDAADGGDLATLVDAAVPADDDARGAHLDAVEAAADAVAARLADRRAEYVAASSPAAWARARHLCDVVAQTCAWHRVRHEHEGPHEAGMAERDRHMSENVAWCLDREPGEGVAVWAHNSHVQRGTFDDGRVWTDAVTMGERLDRALGDRYRPLGMDVARGEFRAGDGAGDGEVRAFAFPEPRPGSATAALGEVGDGPLFLDLAGAADDPRLADWLDGRPVRWVGSVYDADNPGEHYLRTDLRAAFDGLFALPESTPTRPLASA